MEKFYTTVEVADRLRIHPQTLREWIRDGIVRARRIGRRLLFTEADIQAALKEMTPEAQAEATSHERVSDARVHSGHARA
jgi:excisionase family DNA binding protein